MLKIKCLSNEGMLTQAIQCFTLLCKAGFYSLSTLTNFKNKKVFENKSIMLETKENEFQEHLTLFDL